MSWAYCAPKSSTRTRWLALADELAGAAIVISPSPSKENATAKGPWRREPLYRSQGPEVRGQGSEAFGKKDNRPEKTGFSGRLPTSMIAVACCDPNFPHGSRSTGGRKLFRLPRNPLRRAILHLLGDL